MTVETYWFWNYFGFGVGYSHFDDGFKSVIVQLGFLRINIEW